jgi:hypothetical protein
MNNEILLSSCFLETSHFEVLYFLVLEHKEILPTETPIFLQIFQKQNRISQ